MQRINFEFSKNRKSVFLVLLAMIMVPVIADSQIKNVWALSDGEKVFRNDTNHPSKNGNYIWDGTHWRHNSQGPKANTHQNIFQNPLSFTNFGQYSYGNGDGILFYPGRMLYYPEEDRELNAIIPSIRLKNIRRGQQDAVIMKMAEQKIGKDRVLEIISEVVPRALSDVDRKEPVPWSEHGDDYERVRNNLLNIITGN